MPVNDASFALESHPKTLYNLIPKSADSEEGTQENHSQSGRWACLRDFRVPVRVNQTGVR